MPSRRYALEHGGPKRLEVRWQGHGEDLKVFVDNCEVQPLKPFATDYRLPDGSLLSITDISEGEQFEMALLRDGQFVPGTRFDPAFQVQVASVTLLVAGAVHIVVPFVLGDWLRQLAAGLPIVSTLPVVGLVLGGLGLGVMKRSKIAVMIATLLFGAEVLALGTALLVVVLRDSSYIRLAVFGGFALVVILGLVSQAWSAVDELREKQPTSAIEP
jgi:hypothetical protein